MKILTFSSLFPNSIKPSHGVFVEHRLRQLLNYHPDLEARVIAPVPWFPLPFKVFGEYGDFAKVEKEGVRHGIQVRYPRYPIIPKVGMNLTPWLMYQSTRHEVKRLLDQGYDFDLIDAHYFYPDGVAAMYLSREFKKPFVVTGRGTDLNLIPQYPKPREKLQQVIAEAGHMITVAGALKNYLIDMGARDDQVRVLRNGVDLNLFKPPLDRDALRDSLGFKGKVLVSAGHLIERKGNHLTIEAMAQLPDWQLYLIGDGEEEKSLRALAKAKGVDDRVHFEGRVNQEKLCQYYGAADILVLASSREGWANVLLEAMASGTAVVASPVDGTPEVVASNAAGRLMHDLSAQAIVQAVNEISMDMPSREDTRAYAEQFDWDATSQGQLDVFASAIKNYSI